MLISNPEDILSAIGINAENVDKGGSLNKADLSLAEEELIAELQKQNLSADQICRSLNKPINEVGQVLSMLALKNLVGQNSKGDYYVI